MGSSEGPTCRMERRHGHQSALVVHRRLTHDKLLGERIPILKRYRIRQIGHSHKIKRIIGKGELVLQTTDRPQYREARENAWNRRTSCPLRTRCSQRLRSERCSAKRFRDVNHIEACDLCSVAFPRYSCVEHPMTLTAAQVKHGSRRIVAIVVK